MKSQTKILRLWGIDKCDSRAGVSTAIERLTPAGETPALHLKYYKTAVF